MRYLGHNTNYIYESLFLVWKFFLSVMFWFMIWEAEMEGWNLIFDCGSRTPAKLGKYAILGIVYLIFSINLLVPYTCFLKLVTFIC